MENTIKDELAIRNLVASYADAVNRRDAVLWASTWAEEATWELMGNEIKGKQAVFEMWENAMNGFEFVAQLIYQGTLQVQGSSATGRWYLTEHLRPNGSEGGRCTIGTYADRYQCMNGEWLFMSRRYNVLYDDKGKGDMSGVVMPVPF